MKTGLNWRDTLAVNASGQMPKSLPRSVSSIPMVCRNLTTDWIEFRLVAEIEGFSVMALYVSTPMLSRYAIFFSLLRSRSAVLFLHLDFLDSVLAVQGEEEWRQRQWKKHSSSWVGEVLDAKKKKEK